MAYAFAYVIFFLYLCGRFWYFLKMTCMKRLLFAILALIMALGMMAAEKMTFVVAGPESRYNQIRVMNETSKSGAISCRVVTLKDNDEVDTVYGFYELKGRNDIDSNSGFVEQGTKVGIQFPNDFKSELSFTIEYKDYPFFDVIIIHLRDKDSGYDDFL